MIDHVLLIGFMDVARPYAVGFAVSLALFLLTTLALKPFKRANGVSQLSGLSNDALQAGRRKLAPKVQRQLFQLELAEMIFEYGLFACFVSGLDSGALGR